MSIMPRCVAVGAVSLKQPNFEAFHEESGQEVGSSSSCSIVSAANCVQRDGAHDDASTLYSLRLLSVFIDV